MGLKSVKLFKDWFCCGRDQRILSLLFILFLGFVLMMVPIPFLRLHDDEAIYWSISQSLGHGEPRTVRLSSLPFFLVAGVLQISNHLFTARIISSLFTLGSAVLIFLIGEAWWGGRAGSAGALIYLFSFHALRFGSRYLLEGYGSFFFLLTVYLLQRHRVGMAGLFSILPLLCTEVWIPVYPFYWLYVHRRKESLQRFALFSLPGFLLLFLTLLGSNAWDQVANYLIGRWQFSIQSTRQVWLMLSGWGEFMVVALLPLLGFAATVLRRNDRGLLLLVAPQFLVLSLVPGFIQDGALSKYPLGLMSSLALLGGSGLTFLWQKTAQIMKLPFTRIDLFLPLLGGILLVQLLVFNHMATTLNVHGLVSIYDMGYQYDQEVIQLLQEKAAGEVVAGLPHGAFVSDLDQWVWTERNVTRALQLEPHWLVTYTSHITVKAGCNEALDVYEIGPYTLVHSGSGSCLSEAVEATEVPRWRYRG